MDDLCAVSTLTTRVPLPPLLLLQVVHEQVSLSFAATAQLLEGYSGGSDGRSLRTIVANLAPRALVLVGGSQTETQEMANACKRELRQQQTRVYTPGGLQHEAVNTGYNIATNWQCNSC